LGSRNNLVDERRPWTRFRDGAITRLFGRPKTADNVMAYSRPDRGQSAQRAGPRYNDHVVLRFNISTVDEAKSLAEATNILLLDVWESDDNWVDIRLSKDVVCSSSAQPIILHRNGF
jgi:extracellular matrix protein 14